MDRVSDNGQHGGDDRAVPVAPGKWPFLGHGLFLLRRPLDFMLSLRQYGDVVTIYLGTLPVQVITEPTLAHEVLAVEAEKFGKGIFLEKFRPYFGNGLGLSSGDFYRRQRRLVQPSFHRDRIAHYAETMVASASTLAQSWRPGQIVEFDEAMQDLTLTIVGRTLFSTELGRPAVEEIRRNVPILLKDGLVRVYSPKVIEKLPIPGNRRFDRAVARLHRVVDDVITQVRADGTDHGDVLSTLLLTQDEDTGERMSDQQVHDEVVNLLTAGAETSAVTLAWLFHELARHPEVEQRLHAEIDKVLAGRAITVDVLPELTYTRRVINEVLRAHGVWILMRRALVDVDLGALSLPAGTEVVVSPYALHHNPRHFPDPARFDPDRWAPDRAATVPKHAYIPFAAGLHHCPGHQFAHTEIALVTAAIATRWRLVPVPGKPVRTKAHGMPFPSQLPMTVVPRHT
jgi:cytochrome P450